MKCSFFSVLTFLMETVLVSFWLFVHCGVWVVVLRV